MLSSKKKIFIFMLSILCFSFSSIRADEIPQWTAKKVADNYLSYCVALRGTWAGTRYPVITQTRPLTHQNAFIGYSFKVYPKGHLLVPFHDEFSPVLFYSENSDFDPGNVSVPGTVEAWIISDIYQSLEIVTRRNNSAGFRSAYGASRVAAAWTRLKGPPVPALRSVALPTTTGPLLTTKWDQSDPYNLLCPPLDSCAHTLVGCVGLAWAQVMNYWQWPDRGIESRSYNWPDDTKTLSVSFNTAYNWPAMPDQLEPLSSDTEKQAVARLCYDAAISAQTNFGCYGSDSVLWADEVLPLYFKYKTGTARKYWRLDIPSSEEWFALIRTELDASPPRPVIFSIFTNSGGGHETVIDGYREGLTDKVHINFGWNGYQDAYYDITRDFTASWTWSSLDQVIAVGIEPDYAQADLDADNDSIIDILDNCPDMANPAQTDNDTDGIGDLCDNCPQIPNGPDNGTCTSGMTGAACADHSDCGWLGVCSMDQEDTDQDGVGDVCDAVHLCPAVAVLGKNSPQLDLLRAFRDRVLAKTPAGRLLIRFYYQNSSRLSAMVAADAVLKKKLNTFLNILMPVIEEYLEKGFSLTEK